MTDGYNIYRGIGGLSEVDFTTPVVFDEHGPAETPFTVEHVGHSPGATYTYVARPVKDGLETPDFSCNCEVHIGADGEWPGNRPAKPINADARIISGGQIELRWYYSAKDGSGTPTAFRLYYSASPNITKGSPQATETYVGADGFLYAHAFTLTDAATYYFGVAAYISDTEVEGELLEIGPFVADGTAPSQPSLATVIASH